MATAAWKELDTVRWALKEKGRVKEDERSEV
jgi:hypothetical protein